MLHRRQLCLILAFFLSLQLQNFTIRFFLHLTPSFLQFALKVTFEVIDFMVELSLNLALFCLQTLNIASLTLKLLVLFIFELFELKFVALAFTIFNCFANTLVTALDLELLSLHFLFKIALKVSQAVLSIAIDHL